MIAGLVLVGVIAVSIIALAGVVIAQDRPARIVTPNQQKLYRAQRALVIRVEQILAEDAVVPFLREDQREVLRSTVDDINNLT